ncbi:Hypothetical predicted protein, partial [Pelobates cultripes]
NKIKIALTIEQRAKCAELESGKSGVSSCQVLVLPADDARSRVRVTDLPAFQIQPVRLYAHYRLNQEKTQALPITLPLPTTSSLKENYTFDWRTPSLTYLGVKIASSIAEVQKLNYLTLPQQC